MWWYEDSRCLRINDTTSYEYIDPQTILVFSEGKESFVGILCPYISKDGTVKFRMMNEKSKLTFKKNKLCTEDEILVDGFPCEASVGKIKKEVKPQ
jgi:hypothetical protein